MFSINKKMIHLESLVFWWRFLFLASGHSLDKNNKLVTFTSNEAKISLTKNILV